MEQYAEGWITTGWVQVNEIWYEVGGVPSVTTDKTEAPPDLTIHEVAEALNVLQGALKSTQQGLLDAKGLKY